MNRRKNDYNRDAEMSEMIIKASYDFAEMAEMEERGKMIEKMRSDHRALDDEQVVKIACEKYGWVEAKTYTDILHKHRDKAVVASGEIFDAYVRLKRLSVDIRDLEQEKDFFETRLREFDAEYQELLEIINLLEDREKNVPVSKL